MVKVTYIRKKGTPEVYEWTQGDNNLSKLRHIPFAEAQSKNLWGKVLPVDRLPLESIEIEPLAPKVKEETIVGVPVSEVIAKGPAYKIFEDKAVRNAARRIAIKEERIKGLKAVAPGTIIKDTIKGLPRATVKVARAASNLLKKLPYFEEWPEKK